jgi:ribosomal protein L9
MKIILNQDVANLGEEGDVREVKRGYGRNYLIPQGLAVPYSKQTVAMFESKKAAIEKRKEEKKNQAKGLKDRLEQVEISLAVPPETTENSSAPSRMPSSPMSCSNKDSRSSGRRSSFPSTPSR